MDALKNRINDIETVPIIMENQMKGMGEIPATNIHPLPW